MTVTETTLPKPFVFVLMPFDVAFDDIYKFGIKGAANDVGAYAERVDEQIFAEGILDRIFNQISKADVVVADMTGRNPNVFYEVGYAHALGKIVILVTQSDDDIPFDLKHRQHTIYGGRIESLRSELATRLQWAIAEASLRKATALSQRVSLLINGIEVPQLPSSSEPPVLGGDITAPGFHMPIHLRNESADTIYTTSHVYLFASPEAPIVPTEWVASSNVALRSFSALPVDAFDGLTRQYRLPRTTFSTTPPGAVEQTTVQLLLREGLTVCDTIYRLRIHLGKQYFDFPFRLRITLKPPAPNPEPAAETNKKQENPKKATPRKQSRRRDSKGSDAKKDS